MTGMLGGGGESMSRALVLAGLGGQTYPGVIGQVFQLMDHGDFHAPGNMQAIPMMATASPGSMLSVMFSRTR